MFHAVFASKSIHCKMCHCPYPNQLHSMLCPHPNQCIAYCVCILINIFNNVSAPKSIYLKCAQRNWKNLISVYYNIMVGNLDKVWIVWERWVSVIWYAKLKIIYFFLNGCQNWTSHTIFTRNWYLIMALIKKLHVLGAKGAFHTHTQIDFLKKTLTI